MNKYRLLECISSLLIVFNVVYGQESGYVMGWGSQVMPNLSFIHNAVDVAAGQFFSLGLKDDGTLLSWGQYSNLPTPNANFTTIACGISHKLALKSNGMVIAWGSNIVGECDVPNPNTDFVAITAGGFEEGSLYGVIGVGFSAGLKSDGSIIVWGDDTFGQHTVPVPNSGFSDLKAGSTHLLALRTNGSICGWGSNGYGQLNVPVPNSDYVEIAAGFDFSLGLKSDGSIIAWGHNQYGQCDVPEPNSNFIAIDACDACCLGLKSDGSIVSWGLDSDLPAQNSGFTSITAGYGHCLGIKEDGSIVGWGLNNCGQAGSPDSDSDLISVDGGEGDSIFGVEGPSLLLRDDQTVVTCGWSAPTPNANFVAIASDMASCLGLRSDGSILAWPNEFDSLNIVPEPNEDFMGIATCAWRVDDIHTWYYTGINLGLKTDGHIVGWGSGGASFVPTPNHDFVAIDAAHIHAIGLKSAGNIICWGSNANGLSDVPEPNSEFIAVAAVGFHNLGLKANGMVVAWGSNSYGQCDVPLPNANYIAIAAGENHSLGLKTDGSVVCWGNSEFDLLTVPEPNENFIGIAAGGNHSYGIKRITTDVDKHATQHLVSADYDIESVYPNPFNPTVTMKIEVKRVSAFTFSVFDIGGHIVYETDLGGLDIGSHCIQWRGLDKDNRNVSSGQYVLQLQDEYGNRVNRKCLLLR